MGKYKLAEYDPNQAGRLACDNPLCDYEMSESCEWGPHLIGLPCPMCGMSLLTPRDYHDQCNFFATIDWINKWFGWIAFFIPKKHKNNIAEVRIHNGHMEIKQKKGPSPAS